MLSFKEFILEEKKSISSIVKETLKNSGFTADANCSGGRCYEFRDKLHDNLVAHGYKPHKIDSASWTRGQAEELGHSLKVSEFSHLNDNNHAWIYLNGKHYDALNTNGARSPQKMKFFKDVSYKGYGPDDEEIYYQYSKHKRHYDRKKDEYVPIPKGYIHPYDRKKK